MSKLPISTVVFVILVGLVCSGCTNSTGKPSSVTDRQPLLDATATSLVSEVAADQVPDRGNLQRTGEYNNRNATPQLSQVLWSSPYSDMRAGPLVVEGTVIYVNYDTLHAVEATTGKE